MHYFFIGFILAVIAAAVIAGPRGAKFEKPPLELFPDMDRQSKVKYQKPSEFFADGRAARMPVEGTVPMGYLKTWQASEDHILNDIQFSRGQDYVSTGLMGDNWGDGMPEEFELDLAFMQHGREKYEVYCTPCHGATGAGNGIATNYGVGGVANLQQATFVEQPDGQLYTTITHGKGLMFGYGGNLTLKDRWSIVAYIRVLQKAASGSLDELKEEDRERLLAEAQPAEESSAAPAAGDAETGGEP